MESIPKRAKKDAKRKTSDSITLWGMGAGAFLIGLLLKPSIPFHSRTCSLPGPKKLIHTY